MPKPRSLRSLAIKHNATAIVPGPPSPTLSEATQASQMNFGIDGPERIITRADLKMSLQSYENLLSTSAAYRDALMHMSKATADFADAMEACASLKGTSYLSGSRLLTASGLHHLMGNHWHVLSDTIDKQVEWPLRQHLESYRGTIAARSAAYERALREKSRIIRQTEMENMNLARKKNRNLQSFREALAVLQRQVEELDELRVNHYQEILEHEEQVWDFVQGKVSLVVRSTLDVIDRFSSKASDPVIEPMLQSIPDPFDSYGPPKTEDQIFSILAPLSIFNASPSPTPRTHPEEPESSSSFSASPGEMSWTNEQDDAVDGSASQWADVHTPVPSPPSSAKSTATVTVDRSVSPPSASRRSTFPIESGNSVLSRNKGPSGVLKSEVKLRKSLSAISEASSSGSGHVGPTLQTESGSESPPGMPAFPFDSHKRDPSAETVRQADLSANLGTNGLRNTFADEPVWGSQEITSPTASHDEEERRESSSSNATGLGKRASNADPVLTGPEIESVQTIQGTLLTMTSK
ncbi:hypothetical protein ACEPAG_6104 [Sanghuangporus baumii]